MLDPSGFFCFTHQHKEKGKDTQRYAFAYKPPGPLQKGALDELMLAMCKGPLIPDAVVIVGIKDEPDFDLKAELESGTSVVAQQRLKSRIPLLFATVDLYTGAVKATLLDKFFNQRKAEFLNVICKEVKSWTESGLRTAFDPKEVILQAPSGYAYQKPSGSRLDIFLKPDLALKSSATVAFVTLALFQKLSSWNTNRYADLQTVFVDTMAIAPVAYALRDLIALCGLKPAFHIESFHSYGGIKKVKRPLQGTSLCLISASSSMSMHEQWILDKEVGTDEVVTLLTLTSATKYKDGALLAIQKPGDSTAVGPAQLSILIKGENFLPEQAPAKKVLLRDSVHRSDDDVSLFCKFAGKQVFDIFRRSPKSLSKVRALYIDGKQLISQTDFGEWLTDRLLNSVKAATRVIIYQDDEASFELAKKIQETCKSILNLGDLPLLPASKLPKAKGSKLAGVIVCAAVVGKGSQLLEISRCLRDKHDGPRLYIIGFQVAEARSELKTLRDNLRHSKGVPYQVEKYGDAAIGTQLHASFEEETKLYYDSSNDLSKLPGLMAKRSQKLGATGIIGELALLPHGATLSDSMRLRAGFAYWPKDFQPQACHAEALATIGVLLQRARESNELPEEHRLSSESYRHVVLDPENFTRFNDGILQAALLRCSYPAELDYRGDYAASDFMKALIIRVLNRATQEAGEAALEFIAALAMKKLQLYEPHLEEVKSAAKACADNYPHLQRAINFLLAPPAKGHKTAPKLPF